MNPEQEIPDLVVRKLPFSDPGPSGSGPIRPTPLFPAVAGVAQSVSALKEHFQQTFVNQLEEFSRDVALNTADLVQQILSKEVKLREDLDQTLVAKEKEHKELQGEAQVLRTNVENYRINFKRLKAENGILNLALEEARGETNSLKKKLVDKEADSALLVEKAKTFMSKSTSEKRSLEQKLNAQKALTIQAHERITALEEQVASLKASLSGVPSPSPSETQTESTEFLDLLQTIESMNNS